MVLVPSSKPRKDSANVGVKCFRLVSTEVDQPVQEGIVVQPIEDEKDDGVSGAFVELCLLMVLTPDNRWADWFENEPHDPQANTLSPRRIGYRWHDSQRM